MANPADWSGYGPPPASPQENEEYQEGVARGHWNDRLSAFQKLVFTKSFQEENVRMAFEGILLTALRATNPLTLSYIYFVYDHYQHQPCGSCRLSAMRTLSIGVMPTILQYVSSVYYLLCNSYSL